MQKAQPIIFSVALDIIDTILQNVEDLCRTPYSTQCQLYFLARLWWIYAVVAYVR